MIASDLNNPEFVGATNPDARLAVKFYTKPMRMEFESQAQARPIFRDVDFIQIFVPGDSTSVIDTMARDDHKARFPLQWAHYQNKHGGDPKEIGTPLAQWPRVSQAQAEELRALKFFTVEGIANASDAQLQSLGMAAGMSPYAFRDHAQRFLAVAHGDSVVQEAQDKANAASARVAELEEANRKLTEEMQAQFAQMHRLIESQNQPKKRGRPKKEA